MSDWNFSRPKLASKLLKVFDVGITSNIALIAPRRKGKTLFLLSDLAPEAHSHGYVPIYASLWQNMDSPHEKNTCCNHNYHDINWCNSP